MPVQTRTKRLLEVAELFLRLGFTAFGGPAAHVSMMENEVVRRRGWLSREQFLDLLGAVNLIPGPNSTEMAIFIGYRQVGWMGLVLGGCCFILPAAVIVSVIAWAYMHYGKLPQVEGLLYGIKPVIIAIILQALFSLSRTAIKSYWLGIIGLAGAVLSYFGVNPLLILLGGGILSATQHLASVRQPQKLLSVTPFFAAALPAAGSAAPAAAVPFSLWALFLFFLKVGAVLYGSGYVLLAFLRTDLVQRWHWLTESQLLDAVAVGQFTPGPLFTTATFIGYILGGPLAAVIATVAIFLPSFFFVALCGPLVSRVRQSPVAGAFLDGVNIASLALMATVTVQLGIAALIDWLTILLALISGFFLFRYRLNSAWLVLGGALIGLLLTFFRS